MNKEQSRPSGKSEERRGDRVLALPGICEAIELVEDRAWVRAVDEAINKGGQGELGDEARGLINKSRGAAFDQFLRLEIVDDFISDNFDAQLELAALEAGPKIAELWELSEAAGRYLSSVIYWRRYSLEPTRIDYSPLVVVSMEHRKISAVLESHVEELREKGAVIACSGRLQKNHVYLDITDLQSVSLRRACGAVSICRRYLGIKRKDLQPGGTGTINAERALEAFYLRKMGKPSKKIASELGFKVYTQDNPSGSYPLLRKYLKLGSKINEKLLNLDKHLTSVLYGP